MNEELKKIWTESSVLKELNTSGETVKFAFFLLDKAWKDTSASSAKRVAEQEEKCSNLNGEFLRLSVSEFRKKYLPVFLISKMTKNGLPYANGAQYVKLVNQDDDWAELDGENKSDAHGIVAEKIKGEKPRVANFPRLFLLDESFRACWKPKAALYRK